MLRKRATSLATSTIDKLLRATGYGERTIEPAHDVAIAWMRTRERAVRSRRRVVRGQALVITGPGRVDLRPVERLVAGPNELTVEVLVSAISPGTERAQWLRLPNARPPFPYTPGYSAVGRVIAAGSGVTIAPGTLVAVARVPHTSVATVPATWASIVPDGVRIEDAALVYLAIISGYGLRRAGPLAGRRLCVVGAGPIGTLALHLAALEQPGAMTVIATTRRRDAVAHAAGAAFRLATEDLADLEADVVVEATGDPEAIHAAVAAARPRATIVLLGSARGATREFPVAEVQRKRLRLVGAHISSLATEAKRTPSDPFRELADTFLGALADGRLDVGALSGPAVDPREPTLVYERLASGELTSAHFDWRVLPDDLRARATSLVAPPPLPPRHPATVSVPTPSPSTGTRRLRFAVIGCGDIGMSNAKAVGAADAAELVSCFDAVPALAEAACKFGGAPAGTLDEAMDPDRVDAVLLSVPHDLHAPLVAKAAAAGLHVIVEKPLAVDLASARAAADAAQRAGVTLSVCFPFRYEPAIVTARHFVEQGALGAFRGASIVFHADKPGSYWLGGYSGRATSDWRSRRDRSGGGVLIMSLTHHLDFLRHLTGAEATCVSAVARQDSRGEVEDEISVAVEFTDGAVGTVFGSASTPGGPGTHFELWGDTGTIRLEPDPAIFTKRAIDGLDAGRWCALPDAAGAKPRQVFVDRFATAVLEGRAPDVTADDGLAVQAIVEAVYRSVETGGRISPQSLLEAMP